MATTITEVIASQRKDSMEELNFELTKKNSSFLEDILLEQMITTEALEKAEASIIKHIVSVGDSLIDSLDNLKKSMSESFHFLADALQKNVSSATSVKEFKNDNIVTLSEDSFTTIAGLLPAPTEDGQSTFYPPVLFDEAFAENQKAMSENQSIMTGEIVDANEGALAVLKNILQDTTDLVLLQEEMVDSGPKSSSTVIKDKEKKQTSDGGLFDNLGGITGGLKGLSKSKGFVNFLKVGGVAALIGGAISFVDGLQNASDITGKAAEELSTMEKVGAGLASAVSGITFGLVDAKDIYSGFETVGEELKSLGSDLLSLLPDSVQSGLSTAYDKVTGFILDEDTGIFGRLVTGFKSSIDNLAVGNYGDAALDVLTGITSTLFGPESALSRLGGFLFDKYTAILESAFTMLPESFQNTIFEWTEKVSDIFALLFDSFTDLLPKGVTDFFSGKSEGVTGKIANMFGLGSKEETKKEETKIRDMVEPNTATRVATELKDRPVPKTTREMVNEYNSSKAQSYFDSNTIKQMGKKNKAFTADFDPDEVVENESIINRTGLPDSRVEELAKLEQGPDEVKFGRRADKLRKALAKDKNRGEAVPMDTRAATMSKQRMDDKDKAKTASQPVIINQQAPAKEKKTVTRKTEINDLQLAIMNSNMMD